ncbi:MAG: hypothetical protein JXR37_12665 [Kiritimatiellae bacterium]|nr:hypothetical protein [Kiritimatiellia bacterium]
MDSFIDVMSNSIGVLTVILLFAAVVASRTSRFLVRPRWTQLTEKTLHNFEARGDRIYFIDHYKLLEKVVQAIKDIKEKYPDQDAQLEAYARVDITHGTYRVSPQELPAGVVNIVPSGGFGGTSTAKMTDPSSEFQRVMDTLNTEEDQLYIIIRADAWQTYQQANQAAKARGFDVAFEIRASDEPINFTLGSRATTGAFR